MSKYEPVDAASPLKAEPWEIPVVSAGYAAPNRGQVLLRQVSAPLGWRKRPLFEVGYFPRGIGEAPVWSALTAFPWSVVPVHAHNTDKSDTLALVARVWAGGDRGFVTCAVNPERER